MKSRTVRPELDCNLRPRRPAVAAILRFEYAQHQGTSRRRKGTPNPASASPDNPATDRDARSGALFVEFALVLPIFLLILLGIMEFASLLFVRTVMLSSARNAVRAYSIGTLDASQAEQFAVDQLSGFGLSFSAVATPQADSGADRSVQLSTPSGPATLGDPLGLFSGQNVVVQATMRREE